MNKAKAEIFFATVCNYVNDAINTELRILYIFFYFVKEVQT